MAKVYLCALFGKSTQKPKPESRFLYKCCTEKINNMAENDVAQ